MIWIIPVKFLICFMVVIMLSYTISNILVWLLTKKDEEVKDAL